MEINKITIIDDIEYFYDKLKVLNNKYINNILKNNNINYIKIINHQNKFDKLNIQIKLLENCLIMRKIMNIQFEC